MNPDQDSPRAGIHRRKRDVDRLWLKYNLQKRNWTLEQFGAELARAIKRRQPITKASISRRIDGKIPFPANEVEALAKLFDTDVQEVLSRTGSTLDGHSADHGTVTLDGSVTINVTPGPRDRFLHLRLQSQDGWAGATVTAQAAHTPPSTAPRGLYLVTTAKQASVKQFLGVHGSNAILAGAFDPSTPVETIPATEIQKLQKITKIVF